MWVTLDGDATLSPLDRFLRLFTDVRAGEGITAILLASNAFLLLASYYVLRSIRNALILSETTPEVTSYMTVPTVLILTLVVPWYGKLADRVPRRRLINIVTMIFAGCIVVFYLLGQAGVPIGMVYFSWLAVFSVMIIAQFWAFANDIYTREEGERLFPIVAFGQTLGPVVGSTIVVYSVESIGTLQIMLLGGALLLAQVQLTNYVDRRERRMKEADLPRDETTALKPATGKISLAEVQDRLAAFQGNEDIPYGATAVHEREQGEDQAEEEEIGVTGTGAFALVFRTRYLLLVGLLLMLLNFVNTNGGYILNRVVVQSTAAAMAAGETGLNETDALAQFFAGFNLTVSIVTAVIQLFLVSRIVKYWGVAVGLMLLPMISLGAYSLIAFYPVLQYIRWAKVAENSTDYSLNNTVRNMLFLPTTREQKYKAKQTIDSFFVRAGDLGSTAMVFLGAFFLTLSTTDFAVANIVAIFLWLVVAFMIGKEYKRLVQSGETPS